MAGRKGYVYSSNLHIGAERLRADKQRTYELMHIQTGDRALEVGCGPGMDIIPRVEANVSFSILPIL
jgi:ubiquinone/menaquinone biosynthesis C-methylase UbiE